MAFDNLHKHTTFVQLRAIACAQLSTTIKYLYFCIYTVNTDEEEVVGVVTVDGFVVGAASL